MRVRRKGSLVCSLTLSLFVVILLVAAWQYPREVQLVPYVVGIPTLFLFMVLLIGEFYPTLMNWMESALEDLWGGRTPGARVEAMSQDLASWFLVFRVMSWVVIFYVLVFFLGFFLVPPAFVAVFLIMEAEMRPSRAIAASLIASISLYGGMSFLKVELWSGAIPEIIPGLLGGAIIPPL